MMVLGFLNDPWMRSFKWCLVASPKMSRSQVLPGNSAASAASTVSPRLTVLAELASAMVTAAATARTARTVAVCFSVAMAIRNANVALKVLAEAARAQKFRSEDEMYVHYYVNFFQKCRSHPNTQLIVSMPCIKKKTFSS